MEIRGLLESCVGFLLADTVFKVKVDKYCCLAHAEGKNLASAESTKAARHLGSLQDSLMKLNNARNSVAHSHWDYTTPDPQSCSVRTSTGKFSVEVGRISEENLNHWIASADKALIDIAKAQEYIGMC